MNANLESIAKRIGTAIARDTIAEGMPRTWSGLDAQDSDLIPEGTTPEEIKEIERIAETAFGARVNA